MKANKIEGFPVFDFGVPCTVEYYNSNNSWGFGGTRGLKYTFNERYSCIIGRAGTRHQGEFPHVTVYDNDGPLWRLYDETDTLNNREKARRIIHEVLNQGVV